MVAAVLVSLMGLWPSVSIENGSSPTMSESVQIDHADDTTRQSGNPPGSVRLSFKHPSGKAPFPKVFFPPQKVTAGTQARLRQPGTNGDRPRVVCGLTVWEVDPEVDPNMPRFSPEPGIDFRIRRVIPKVCDK